MHTSGAANPCPAMGRKHVSHAPARSPETHPKPHPSSDVRAAGSALMRSTAFTSGSNSRPSGEGCCARAGQAHATHEANNTGQLGASSTDRTSVLTTREIASPTCQHQVHIRIATVCDSVNCQSSMRLWLPVCAAWPTCTAAACPAIRSSCCRICRRCCSAVGRAAGSSAGVACMALRG